ncbi:MAG: hypothetical protein ACR2P0_07350 [Acidimicrobiales bacterium]
MLVDVGRVEASGLASLTELVAWVLDAGAGSRWCNLDLEVDEDQHSGDSVLFGFLAARGPSSPFATVMSAERGKRPRPPEIGVQHRAGPKSVAQLASAGVTVPEGWFVRQDHPRRGLVVEVGEDTSAPTLTSWVLEVMFALNRAETTGAFRFEIHEAS